MKLKIGGDPEIFLKDTKNGQYVSATEFDLPGTKRKPHPVKCGAVQVDGTAFEINIDPATTKQEFSLHLKTVLDEARGLLPEHVAMEFVPVVHYDKTYFSRLPKRSLELGCDPDYNARTGLKNPMPQPIGTMRTASGHLTLGWGDSLNPMDPNHFYDCRQMSLRLDQYFKWFKPLWDTDQDRHNLYGANGAFRPKSFGVEYRVLSNAWVGRPEIWDWVFDSVSFVFNHALSGKEPKVEVNQWNTPVWYVHNKTRLGYDKNYRDVYGDYEKPLKKRIDIITEYTADIFGDKNIPEFPPDFHIPTPDKVKLYYDTKGRII